MENNTTIIRKRVKDNNRAVEESKTLNYGKEDGIKKDYRTLITKKLKIRIKNCVLLFNFQYTRDGVNKTTYYNMF